MVNDSKLQLQKNKINMLIIIIMACIIFVSLVHRPEVNIKPWEILLGELKEGNKRTEWLNREPYAYWKGNPSVAETRQDLMKCNVSDKQDWNARLYAQVSIKSISLTSFNVLCNVLEIPLLKVSNLWPFQIWVSHQW